MKVIGNKPQFQMNLLPSEKGYYILSPNCTRYDDLDLKFN